MSSTSIEAINALIDDLVLLGRAEDIEGELRLGAVDLPAELESVLIARKHAIIDATRLTMT